MSRLSPRNKAERVRRFRWGPTDPRARVRWFRLAERIASECIRDGASNLIERMTTKGGAR